MRAGEEWQSTMIGLLCDERRDGELDFARAWRHATLLAAAEGVRRPRDFTRCEADDPGWLPPSTFFREACRRGWNGAVHCDFAGLRESVEDGGLSVSTRPHKPSSGRVALIA